MVAADMMTGGEKSVQVVTELAVIPRAELNCLSYLSAMGDGWASKTMRRRRIHNLDSLTRT